MQVGTTPAVDGVITVHAAGELDMETVDLLDHGLRAALAVPGVTMVVADLAATSFCDSSGLNMLDRFYADATAEGVAFWLDPIHPAVRRVLEIAGMAQSLTRPSRSAG
ncbi:STAS domain-containing protein [Paractinoplanes rishiriensis]|uniref:Anti-sigma factor antagonist n=1 Tax=Paractinoplanes rishiriensis TaxID=1050105 RepID=A0A919MZQ5_9ACTN|nr:STAS domain-containing protein [Actinoplanes rishiriensis]GIF01829.1 anti-sigma factor antagonist [Actinoplanes rishiriensis]